MTLTALLMSAALAAAPVPADPVLAEQAKPVTILLDQSDQCGIGRAAYDQRAQSRRKAVALKRALEKEGRTVRLLILHPGTKLGDVPGPLVINPAC